MRISLLKSRWLWLLVTLLVIVFVTRLAPQEKVLGASARLVYLHGAWIWVASLVFIAAGFVGLAGLISRKPNLYAWSRALGRTGLLLWIFNLPLSLYIMQASWNGLFLSEPRWQMVSAFAVAGLLLQVGLSIFRPIWACIANPIYGSALVYSMSGLVDVMHPAAPVLNSDSRAIQVFFAALVVLLLLAAWQIGKIWRRFEKPKQV
jgi:hypothetical protein